MKRIMVGVVAVAAIAMVGSQAQAQVQTRQSSELLKQVTVKASELKFVLSTKTAKRGVVVFKVTNTGAVQHDFSIKGRKTKLLSHGQSATLRVSFLRKGNYPYKCTVPGHAAAGMKGVFKIT
jgi:uncharacterized cupredoxin-like copper-binding protein